MSRRNHDDDYEGQAKHDKLRKPKKGKSSKSSDLETSFWINAEEFNGKSASGLFSARIVEVHKKYSFVSPDNEDGKIETRDVWIGTVARKYLQADRNERNFVAVGDRVICKKITLEISDNPDDLPQCTIEHGLVRKSAVSRLDPMTGDRVHVLASNVDQLLIVASYLNPTVKWGLIDRYLVLAEEQRLPAIIILNKADLLKESTKTKFVEECGQMLEIYRSLGYQVFQFTAEDKRSMGEIGIAQLQDIFRDKISLLSGHSGVGKSSLINLMRPEIEQDVEKDDILYKGRHTTTYASLIKLGTGGYVIDTPGIRSFAIAERGAVDLSWCFVELRDFIGKCKFRECRHVDEPECLVREAVRAGKISMWRYRSYIAILTGASGREGRMRDIQI
jgi:ribosome biogenesis GTPase